MPRSHSGEGATMIKDLHTSMTLLRCYTMLSNCPEINPQQNKNILTVPYKLGKISGDLTTIIHELATGRGE